MDDLGTIFSLNNWPGHLSYVLIAVSYWLTDMFWLRAERPATATVIAEGDARALVFERAKLSQFFRNEAEVAGLIYQLLGRELAHKIKVSNTLLSTGTA
jgi:CRP-like cAMP-binding protein